jgi:YtcA family
VQLLRRSKAIAALSVVSALTGCGRAPSFNILGSFFPAWLICMVAGVVLAAAAYRVLAHFKLDKEISWTILVYPCLAALFACSLWLIFFG